MFSRPFWLSLKPDELSALAIKVARDEKFSSEIFIMKPKRVLLHCKILRSEKATNRKRINAFAGWFRSEQVANEVSPGGNIE